MKKLTILLGLLISTVFNAQNFVWVNGTSTAGIAPSYGTQGVAAPANHPGSRHGAGRWVDASGNIWLFGGEGVQNFWYNDLWKYDVTTNQWTWMKGNNTTNVLGVYGTVGMSASSNAPGAREFPSCWTDASGNFWMFGGAGYSSAAFGNLGDLWKYDPATNEWTWMNGFNIGGQSGVYGTLGTAAAGNRPGGRYGAGCWRDGLGNMWMLGGKGNANSLQGFLNDLWKYDPSTNQWTWISGANTTNQLSTYGTQAVPSTGNVLGARFFPTLWGDAANNLYVFGGQGFATASGAGFLNDLWKYDVSSGSWMWVTGSSTLNPIGTHGTLGVPASTVMPGGRYSSAYWVDASYNLWIFGGEGWGSSSTAGHGQLNDLLYYNVAANEWAWMSGGTVIDLNGTYGTMNVSAPTNSPGGRMYNTYWKTPNGKFWLYGGEGFDATQTSTDNLNDLWTYTPPCNPSSVTVAPNYVVCSGATTTPTLTAVNGGPNPQWYSSPSSTSAIGTGSAFTVPTLTTASAASVYTFYVQSSTCYSSTPRSAVSITVNPAPTVSVSADRTVVCKGEHVDLQASGANSYNWNSNMFTTQTVTITYNQTGVFDYTVVGTAQNGCSSSNTISIKVNACLGIDAAHAESNYLSVYPNPSNGSFYVDVKNNPETAQFVLFNSVGQKVMEEKITESRQMTVQNISRGLYIYQLKSGNKILNSGKLIIE